ncbi:MAG: MmgE/PrpD family protein [Polyangiaceae bacterium]
MRPLAEWVAKVRYEDVPPSVLRAARFQVLNMVAAVHAASQAPEVACIDGGLLASAPPGGSTVLARGFSLGPADATLANAAYAMAHDFDDIVWMGHTCHSAVFAPLAVAEHEDATERELLLAVVIANEIGGRLGASCFLGPLNGQMWSFIHLVGAAAATAKLLMLDATRTEHALAIALAQPGFPLQPGFMKPTSKLLTAGTPAAIGVKAAYFARAGMTGEPTILEDPRGLWRRFSFVPLPEMLGDLGRFWVLSTLAMKTYPGCFYFQTACTAIERLVARRGPLSLDEVSSITVRTTKLALEVTRFASAYLDESEPVTAVAVNFDLRLTLAVLLTARRLTSQEMHEGWLRTHESTLRAWQARIKVRHDPTQTAKLVASARKIDAGRAAIARLRLRDLPNLLARYRAEYASQPMTLDEAKDAVVSLARRGRKRSAESIPPNADATPLLFPSAVEIKLAAGGEEREEVELPVGSIASIGVESELARKFLSEVGDSIGPARAKEAYARGLVLGEDANAKTRALVPVFTERRASSVANPAAWRKDFVS